MVIIGLDDIQQLRSSDDELQPDMIWEEDQTQKMGSFIVNNPRNSFWKKNVDENQNERFWTKNGQKLRLTGGHSYVKILICVRFTN